MTDTPQKLLQCQRFWIEQVESVDREGNGHLREVVRHPGSVVVIPLFDDDRVCLIKNFRVAVNETLLELPAGTREAGEPAEQTASRELTEETGLRAGRVRRLTSFYAAPGILDELMIVFVAHDLKTGPPSRESGEQIENHIVSWKEALRLIRDGTIRDAKTIAALLTWDLTIRATREPTGDGH